LGGELTLTLLQQIGKGIEVHQADLSLYKQAISLLQEFVEDRQKKSISSFLSSSVTESLT